MNHQMKKSISLLVAVIILSVSGRSFADFSDVPSTASYYEAVNHLESLGIISGNEKGEFKPNDLITREQFARLVIAVAGEDYKAEIYKYMVIFPDISSSRWSSGYINAAVQLGYIKGMLDGKFHPTDSVTYAQVCTVLVKMLGYIDNDLPGTWPQNYMIKAKETGIADGVQFRSNEVMPRWAVVVMLDNLLGASVKANPSKTFTESVEFYTQYIVLATSKTSDTMAEDEVLTDKGIYLIGDTGINLEPGRKYRLNIKNDIIHGIYSAMGDVFNISVESSAGTTVTYRDESGLKTIDLPSKTSYYHKGVELKYEDIPKTLQTYSSIVINKNSSGSGYEYAVIFNPVYSKPQVPVNSNRSTESLGDIKIEEGIKITKNGKIISSREIDDQDVVYQVSDIWGKNKYILANDESTSGEITSILPNKISPKTVYINGVGYELGKYMDYSKINSQGILKVGDSVTAILGYDGKVVDLFSNNSENNSNYALVLNNYTKKSDSIEDYGKEVTYVKLLHTDNTTRTYKLKDQQLGYTARLVKYKVMDGDTEEYPVVELQNLEYLNAKEYIIDKERRKIDSNYFADNIKIFNLVNEVHGTDSQAYLMNWSDLPDGAVLPGKIRYLNKSGVFEDVNVMLVDNILDEDKYLGVVTKVQQKTSPQRETIHTNTILIGDKEYVTNYDTLGVYAGAIAEVEMRNGQIVALTRTVIPMVESTSVNAIDSSRIKIGSNIYEFKNNAAIYFKDYEGTYIRKGVNDIRAGEKYGKISVYLDKSAKYGGKVELIIVSQ